MAEQKNVSEMVEECIVVSDVEDDCDNIERTATGDFTKGEIASEMVEECTVVSDVEDDGYDIESNVTEEFSKDGIASEMDEECIVVSDFEDDGNDIESNVTEVFTKGKKAEQEIDSDVEDDGDDIESNVTEDSTRGYSSDSEAEPEEDIQSKIKFGMEICGHVLAHIVAPRMPRDRVVALETTFTFTPSSSPSIQQAPSYRPSSPTYRPSIRRPVTPYPSGLDLRIARACRTDPQPSTSRGVCYTPPPPPNVMQQMHHEDRGVLVNELEVADLPTPVSRAYQAVKSDSEENDLSSPLCILCLKRSPRLMFTCRHACYCLTCIKRLEYRFFFENAVRALDCPFCKVRLPYFPFFY